MSYVDRSKPAEIYSAGLQFSFASEDLEQCHGWVLCKDFLHDVIFGILNKSQVSIYGFTYDYRTMPHPDMKQMRMFVRDRNMSQHVGKFEMEKRIANLAEFMNKVETKLGFELSTVEEVQGVEKSGKTCKDRIFLITGDKRWMHAPPMISLFTLYVRAGLFHTAGDSYDKTIRKIKKKEEKAQANDANYLNSSRKFRLAILKYGVGAFLEKMEDNYNLKKIGIGDGNVANSIYSIHGCLGIVHGKTVKVWKTAVEKEKTKE